MKSKSMMLMVLSMGFGLIAAIGISQVMGRSSSAQPATEMGAVLVAADHLDMYAKLSEENVKIENWPANIIPEDAVTSLDEITDKIVLSRLSKGMPVVGSITINEKEHKQNGLAIPKGSKVVAIKVAGDDTISGLLKPGDKVDVIGFFKKRGSDGQTQMTSKTFLKALVVWSVDGSLRVNNREENTGSGSAIVGVLVNEKQSEEIYYAQQTGTIKLVLRGDYVESDEDVEDLSDLMNWDSNEPKESMLSSEPQVAPPTQFSPSQPKARMVIWERGSPREITFTPNELPMEAGSGGGMEDEYGDEGEYEGEVDSGDFSGSEEVDRNPQRAQ